MTKELYNEVFHYSDGKLTWKKKISRNTVAGKQAPTKVGCNGYLRVSCFGKLEYQHRVIWVMHNGIIKKGLEVDHINRDRLDNRIKNLRLVTSTQNKWNMTAKGCYYDTARGVYRAKITTNGKTTYLGSHSSLEKATEAYEEARKTLRLIPVRNL